MKITHVLMAMTVIIPSAAFADPLPIQDHGLSTTATTLLLSQLRNEYLVLQQEQAIADLKDKLHLDGSSNAVATPDPVPTSVPEEPATLPTVLSLFGGRHITATLLLPSGTTESAYPGEGLPGGLTVYDVSTNGVRVMQGGNLITLPFAGDTPDQSGTGQAPGFGATPQLPGANIPMPMSVYPRARQ
jgi:type IV pilus biogenesis protein PilP